MILDRIRFLFAALVVFIAVITKVHTFLQAKEVCILKRVILFVFPVYTSVLFRGRFSVWLLQLFFDFFFLLSGLLFDSFIVLCLVIIWLWKVLLVVSECLLVCFLLIKLIYENARLNTSSPNKWYFSFFNCIFRSRFLAKICNIYRALRLIICFDIGIESGHLSFDILLPVEMKRILNLVFI